MFNVPSQCSTSIAAASNLVVQLFQPKFHYQIGTNSAYESSTSIRLIPKVLIKRYALLQSADFLYMLSAVPKISETFLHLTDLDYTWYQKKLLKHRQNISSAIKAMKGRKAIDED